MSTTICCCCFFFFFVLFVPRARDRIGYNRVSRTRKFRKRVPRALLVITALILGVANDKAVGRRAARTCCAAAARARAREKRKRARSGFFRSLSLCRQSYACVVLTCACTVFPGAGTYRWPAGGLPPTPTASFASRRSTRIARRPRANASSPGNRSEIICARIKISSDKPVVTTDHE